MTLEIRTDAGPSITELCELSGGPYIVPSHMRHVHVVCPPTVPETGLIPDKRLIRAETVPVRHRVGGWMIHFPAVVFTSSPNTIGRLRRAADHRHRDGGCWVSTRMVDRKRVSARHRGVRGDGPRGQYAVEILNVITVPAHYTCYLGR